MHDVAVLQQGGNRKQASFVDGLSLVTRSTNGYSEALCLLLNYVPKSHSKYQSASFSAAYERIRSFMQVCKTVSKHLEPIASNLLDRNLCLRHGMGFDITIHQGRN